MNSPLAPVMSSESSVVATAEVLVQETEKVGKKEYGMLSGLERSVTLEVELILCV